MSNSGGKFPNAEEVRKNHYRSDVDSSPKAQHHTLGEGPNNAASGQALAELRKQLTDLIDRVTALEEL